MTRPEAVGPKTKLNSDVVGNVAQYRLDTRHELNRDYWNAILDFADHSMTAQDNSGFGGQ